MFVLNRIVVLSRTKKTCEYSVLRRVTPGCFFGDLDFFLQQPHTLRAVATGHDRAVSYRISRTTLQLLSVQQPALALLLQNAVLKTAYTNTSIILPNMLG